MITEDYCSFEVAKLLKEKGFHEPCIATYNSTTKNFHVEEIYEDWTIHWKDYISAPTYQMAMKWLREVHNLFIVIDKHYFVFDKISHIASGFKYSIEIKKINTVYTHNDYKSYEEAVEATLKYCLENLI